MMRNWSRGHFDSGLHVGSCIYIMSVKLIDIESLGL
jgi:hypothetical protein